MIRWFASHPTAANLLMLGFVILGLFSALNIRRETFPDYNVDEVEITVVYPGATPTEVEREVVRRVEDAIDGVTFVEKIRAEARANTAIINIEMNPRGQLVPFINDLQTEIDSIDDFPPLIEEPILKEKGKISPVVSIAVTGIPDPVALKTLAEQLKDDLKAKDEISLVRISGFSDQQIRIELDYIALQEYGLSIQEVARIVSQQSVDFPAGDLETDDRVLTIKFSDKRRSIAALGDLQIRASEYGGQVLLSDVSRIFTTFEEEEEQTLFASQRAGYIVVEKTDLQDSLTIYNTVKQFVEEQNATLPPGIVLHLTEDQASIVQDRLSLLIKNGWQGLLLVLLVLGCVFSLRFALWVALSIPISFLGGFYFFPHLGITINMISMVGLLMALGLLMDDSIVIAENIMAKHQEGLTPFHSVTEGTSEVFPGVFASFLTTVAVFLPLTFISGEIGKILRVMPLTLILVMSVSMIEAFLILPHHLKSALNKDKPTENRLRKYIANLISSSSGFLCNSIVPYTIRYRYITAGFAALILCSSLALLTGGILKFQVFPDLEGDIIHARILMPQGTPLNRTRDVVSQLTSALDEVNESFSSSQPDSQHLIRQVAVDYSKNVSAFEKGPHVATVKVDLLSAEIRRNASIESIIEKWREYSGEIPGAIAVTYSEPSLGPAGNPIEIQLVGENLERLKLAATDLRKQLSVYKGTFNLLDDLRPGQPELQLKLHDVATRLGLTAQDIANQLRASYFGSVASEMIIGENRIEVDLRLAGENRDSLDDFDNFRVRLPDGSQTPLEYVADIEQGRNWSRIHRIDGKRTVSVIGEVDTRTANTEAILADLEENYIPQLRKRYPEIKSIIYEGERSRGGETSQSMLRNFTMGLIGIFLILSFQFRSFIEPIIVMSAIPFILVGVIWGHFLMGYPITLPSMMGFFALAGVVVNNSILLVEFIKIHRRKGMSLHDGIVASTRQRFRPIVLSTATTLAGLLPLLFETSLQAQVLIPLAISLVFGLASSTILVLLILPAFYFILDDFKLSAPVFERNEVIGKPELKEIP